MAGFDSALADELLLEKYGETVAPEEPTLAGGRTTRAPFSEPLGRLSPVAASINEYEPWRKPGDNQIDALLQEHDARKRTQKIMNLRDSLDQDPVKSANIKKLARAAGINENWLDDDVLFKDVSNEQMVRASEAILSEAPLLDALVTNDPWTARLMSDSLGNLAAIERAMKNPGYTIGEHLVGFVRKTGQGLVGDTGGSALSGSARNYQILSRALAAPLIAAGGDDMREFLTRPLPDLFEWLNPGRRLDAAGDALTNIGDMIGGDTYESRLGDVGRAVGQLGGLVLLRAGAGPGATTPTLQAIGMDIMSEKTAEDDVEQWRKDMAGIVGSAVAPITENPVLDRVFGTLVKAASRDALATLQRIGITAGMEFTQEIIENTLMDGVRMIFTNPEAGTDLAESIKEGETAGMAAALVQGMVEVFIRVRDRSAMDRSNKQIAQIEKAINELREAPAFKRDAESFAQTVNDLAPDQRIYVDAEQLRTVVAENAIPAEAFPELSQNLEAQQGVGSGLEFRAGDFMARVANLEARDAVLDQIRMAPGEMSRAEIRQEIEKGQAEIAAQAQSSLESEAVREEFRESLDRLRRDFRDEIETQLGLRGREAQADTELLGAWYAARAAEFGVMPTDIRDGWADSEGRTFQGFRPTFAGPEGRIETTEALAQGGAKASALFPETNRLSNLKQDGAAWARLRSENPALRRASASEGTLTVYRATIGDTIRPGDFVAANRKVAENALENLRDRGEEGSIVSQEVSVRDLLMANDATEFVYSPEAFDQDRRGQFSPADLTIQMLAGADKSTFIHESAHFFLTAHAQMAVQEGAPPEMREQAEAMLKEVGFEGTLEQWIATPLEQQREAHERVAESFEQYILTGKAPTDKLKRLYRTLSNFMRQVYQSVKEFVARSPRARLNPELEALFDRWMASEAEIDAAMRDRAYAQFFRDQAEAGMTPEQWAEYMADSAEHQAEAKESLRALMMQDIREQSRDTRKAVEDEVLTELTNDPVYQVALYLRRGKLMRDGEVVAETQNTVLDKMAISGVRDIFPNLTDQEMRHLGYGKYGMLSTDGMHPDVIAQMFNFRSGEDMLRRLLRSERMQDAVPRRVNEIMFERYNELSSPEAMSRAVDEAIHNEAGMKRLATELAALYQRVGQKSEFNRAAREFAKNLIASKTVRELSPAKYSAAEARAGKKSLDALRKEQREEAKKQQRIELMNHAAAMEAHKATREIDAMVTRMRRIAAYNDKSNSVKNRDGDMVNAVRVILGAYGIGPAKQIEKGAKYLGNLHKYDAAKAEFLEAQVQAAVENAGPWRDQTVAGMREVGALVTDLWADARASREMDVAGEKVTFERAEQELRETAEKTVGIPTEVPGQKRAATDAEKRKGLFQSFNAWINRVLPWTGIMDGKRDGPFREYFWHTIAEASTEFRRVRNETIAERFSPLVQEYRDLFKNTADIDATQEGELGYTFNGDQELIAFLLHTGNASNLRKLLIGGRPGVVWGDVREDGTLDTSRWDRTRERLIQEGKLTKRHYDFVQSVWDILEDIKPGAQRTHRAMFGRFFDEIAADTVMTPWGAYRGGYFPAVADPNLITDDIARRMAEDANQNFSYAMPDKGFTQTRVEYNRPLKLDMAVATQHIDKVLMFTHLAKPVRDVRRLIAREGVRDMLFRIDPNIVPGMLEPYLERVAHQMVETRSKEGRAFEGLAAAVRRNTAMAYMFLNPVNTMLQFTGAPLALLKVSSRHLLRAQAGIVAHPIDSYKFIQESSPFMAERLTNKNALMYDHMREVMLNPSVYGKVQDWAQRNAYITQIYADRIISTTVWLGAYNQALENAPANLSQDKKERRAIRQADDAVRQTQMDQSPEGVAAFEAGGAWWRLFTQFTGYFNMWARTSGEELSTALRNHEWARMSFVAFIGLVFVPALGEAIRLVLSGGPDDEEGDGYLDDWIGQMAWGTFKFYTAAAPILGSWAVSGLGWMANDPFSARVMVAPAAGAVESVGRAVGAGVKLAQGEEVKPSRIIRDTSVAINLFTGLPLPGMTRQVGYAADVEAGYVSPTSNADFVRGMLTGVASPDSK